MPEGVELGRFSFESTNYQKVSYIYDYAYGNYLGTRTFFDQLSQVQADLIDKKEITLDTGQKVSPDTPGGLIAIQLYMDAIEASRVAINGLTNLGLKIENKIWANI